MWSIDLFIDLGWSKEQALNWPIEPKLKLNGKFLSFPDLILEQKFYGDEFGVKFIRFTGNFKDELEVSTFCSQKLNLIKNSIELCSGLVSGIPINFASINERQFITVHFEHKQEDNPMPATSPLEKGLIVRT